MTPSSNKKASACVIGMDGVPFDLLVRLAKEGIMPAVGRLIQAGHLHRMKASLPEVSSVSWTSFMTGTNPGTHGIFGFTDLRDHSYQIRFPNSLDVKAPTIWDKLGKMGLKSIVINQPSTYPAKRIEGALVAGFVAIELAKAVYPLSHLAALERMNYRTDIDTEKARRDHPFLWKELDSTLEGGRRAFRYFWDQDWNLFEFIVTGTDRLQHFLWDACMDSGHSEHARFVDYYRKVDGLTGEVITEFEKRTGGIAGLYLLSDHGFTGIVQEFYLNAWLEQSGYLRFEGTGPRRLSDMAPGTRAFALDPGRIYLNHKRRFPRGVVDSAETKGLKSDICAALKMLRYEDKKVIREVFDAEEIYAGPCLTNGPDLVVLSEPGFDVKGTLEKKSPFGRSDLQGMHTWDDAFFWSSKGCGEDLAISDVAAMILEEFV